jgi:hypothetical protein
MFAVLNSDINSLKSGLLHLTGQPYCKKSRSAKVKDGIINLSLRNYRVDQYTGGIFGYFLFSLNNHRSMDGQFGIVLQWLFQKFYIKKWAN